MRKEMELEASRVGLVWPSGPLPGDLWAPLLALQPSQVLWIPSVEGGLSPFGGIPLAPDGVVWAMSGL